jgi:hypothetical protein
MLGAKIKYNILTMGNKKSGGEMLGNKKNGESKRRILETPSNNVVNRTSPIEKYNVKNY